MTEEEYRAILVATWDPEWAAICLLSESDRNDALARVDEMQGESPRDRAWPTEGGNEPDPSGTFRPAVVRQVYEDLMREGKIKE